jgi:hypothetical protein
MADSDSSTVKRISRKEINFWLGWWLALTFLATAITRIPIIGGSCGGFFISPAMLLVWSVKVMQFLRHYAGLSIFKSIVIAFSPFIASILGITAVLAWGASLEAQGYAPEGYSGYVIWFTFIALALMYWCAIPVAIYTFVKLRKVDFPKD